MHLRITGDINAESGVAEVVYEISGPAATYFKANNYGGGLLGLVVVLMCRDPEINFKRRIRFSKKDKKLYMDIMLNLEQLKNAVHEIRKKTIAERIADEVPIVLRKYSIPDFDEARFVEDLKTWLNGM